MNRFGLITGLLAGVLALAGCNQGGPDIDRIQTNLVDKSIFEGEWWYAQTMIDVDGDGAGATGAFDGSMAFADMGLDKGESLSMARIRWVIDEDFLFAYRAYELIDGGNEDGRSEDFRGQPLAAFRIENHVDVRYDYNALTGEKTNVRVEDTSDRRWYERQFIRVDWSQNVMTSFYYLWLDVGGMGGRESAAFHFQPGAHEDFPASYAPQYVRVSEDPSYRFAAEWPADMQDAVHYMSFVTMELYSPRGGCFYVGGGVCQTTAVTIRNSFLRVPPDHEFAVETQNHNEFDRFGTFRTYQRTYIRGGRDEETAQRRCEADLDCGTGGLCEGNICIGGLTEDRGELDFLTFYRPRHNHFTDHLTDTACLTDWQCDGRYADTPGMSGSVCDRSARLCTVPMASRPLRQVVYHLNAGFPRHLAHAAFESVGDWNGSFMSGWRASRGEPLPSGDNVACQSDNPIGYCYCGSPDDVGDGTCAYKYDPFVDPATLGTVTNPYRCHIQGPADPARPASYEDYTDDVFDYEFVGDECAFVLRANSCDRDPEAACEELGDIRYQFFNYIQHGNLGFGGVSLPLVDPTTGELITSNANMAAPSVEYWPGLVRDYFPVLRDEPGAAERWFEGEVTRDYFDNLGRVERPVGYAPSGDDGFGGTGGTRPGLPLPTTDHLRGVFEANAERFQRLAPTAEGRANILSDRMRLLAGTQHEARLLESIGPSGADLVIAQNDVNEVAPDTRATDASIIDTTSPFREGFIDGGLRDRQKWISMGRYNVDPPMAPEISNVIYKYWADTFADRPAEEASIRMQQLYLRGVMHHELGHSVGLRHNFAGTYDRNNYHPGYYNVVVRDNLALPRLTDEEYDPDGDTYVSGDDVTAYQADLRDVRNRRHAAGLGMVMTNSVMDYDGDMSGFGGLGYYDVAAANYNAFNVVEAYTGDPTLNRTDSLDGATDVTARPRTWFKYYTGGESCSIDTECPYNRDRVSQAVYQRCIQNPRGQIGTQLPVPCGDDDLTPDVDESQYCVCSSFDEDFLDYRDNIPPYENDVDGDGETDFFPIDYLFCSDDRVIDISWCNRFDAGESFQETVDFWRREWEESYPSQYYRRFRDTSLPGLGSLGSIIDAAKVYQHLFFRYFYEPGFASQDGPLGFDDQFLASIEAMNWMTELATMPQSGSYQYDADAQVYRFMGEDMDMAGSDLSLPVGMGFPMWSQYQDGYWGYYRRERAGVFMDKFYALFALAIRDWGFSFTIDERFFINFFDLFPVEMTEFFGGVTGANDRWFGPRVDVSTPGDPRLQYLSWYRGTCRPRGIPEPCRGSQEATFPGRAIADTSNEILRDWATILSLSQFPVFYDTSFEQRLSLFKLDSGEGFTIPDTQRDGSRTCAYGDYRIPGSTHAVGCTAADADYVVYESDRVHTGYVAVKVRHRLEFNLEEEQLGFELLRRLVDLQNQVRALRAIGSPTPAEINELRTLEGQLNSQESYLEYLIDIQRVFGINRYF